MPVNTPRASVKVSQTLACDVTRTQVASRLTSNGRPEEDEGQTEGTVFLLNLPRQHHKQEHIGQHMLEAGVNQNAGHPPAREGGSVTGVSSVATR